MKDRRKCNRNREFPVFCHNIFAILVKSVTMESNLGAKERSNAKEEYQRYMSRSDKTWYED